jgi:hypothetical protein
MATNYEFKQWGTHYVPGMEETWQNKEFVYAGLYMDRTVNGDELQEDFIGTLEMKALPDEYVAQDFETPDYEAVRGKANTFYVASRWREAEIERMRPELGNPISDTMREHMNAYRRKKSTIFRDAATANVDARFFGQTSFTNQALDSDQQLGTGAAITVENIRSISSLFERRFGLINGEKPYLAVSREEKDTLLGIEELINKDYNLGAAPTITGEFGNMVEGVQLIMDQDLNVSGGARTCISWLPSAMVYMSQRAPKVRFGEQQANHWVPEAYFSIDEGALRRRKYGVISLSTEATYTI